MKMAKNYKLNIKARKEMISNNRKHGKRIRKLCELHKNKNRKGEKKVEKNKTYQKALDELMLVINHFGVVSIHVNYAKKQLQELVDKYNKEEVEPINKFQEALDELLGNAVQQQSHIGGYENSEYVNMNGINKMIGYSQTLQKLVDRATQAIDWSE